MTQDQPKPTPTDQVQEAAKTPLGNSLQLSGAFSLNRCSETVRYQGRHISIL